MAAGAKILYLIPEDHYFWSHRLPLARAARRAGYNVVVAMLVNKHGGLIKGEGFKLIPLRRLQRGSRNPWHELMFLGELLRIFRSERPAIVHSVTLKPVLYGSWAALCTGVPVIINALASLGYVFIAKGLLPALIKRFTLWLFKLSFSFNRISLILQNPEDQRLFVEKGIIPPDRTVLIRGSGVDPVLFKFTPEPAGIPVVMLASRLLFDKGVGELVEAARLLKNRGVKCRVALVGEPDPGNPASIPVECLLQWQKEGHTEWWGRRGDMAEVLALANLVVLPSYREGLPKILLEAASCGRAIIAADVPGCREIVIHGKNGILVPVRDPAALAEAVEELLKKPALRAQMGAEGRKLVVKEFSEERVVQETLALYDRLVGKAGAGK